METGVSENPMQHLIERCADWINADPDIRGAIIVGSQARADHPADALSDLDLVVFTTEPKRYLSTTEWLAQIGSYWLTFLEDTPIGDLVERRVLFEGGQDVDFNFVPVEMARQMAQQGVPEEAAGVLRRGMRVLADKDGLIAALTVPPATGATPIPPTQEAFQQVVNDFLYHALWTAKKLKRGEIWTAITCCDGSMKWSLLRMIEWHTRWTQDECVYIWHSGRFLEEWAAPRALAKLRHAFAHYETADVQRALLATMELFREVAMEVAARLDFPYPTEAEAHIMEWIESSWQT